MKTDIYSITGEKKAQIELPSQFSEPVRKDLISRAVIAVQSRNFQQHGADQLAGTRQGQPMPKRRKKYKTTYGHGISRIRRKYMWHRGMQFGWVGAYVANTVGGRSAFSPKPEKILIEQINVKERRKAIRSAIAAADSKVIEDKFESLKKAADVEKTLDAIGLKDELARASKRKIRAGRGKMRGRKYRTRKGPLLVVSKGCDIVRAARNIPGIDVAEVSSLNALLLAPGTKAGRITIWTESAIKRLDKERMFI